MDYEYAYWQVQHESNDATTEYLNRIAANGWELVSQSLAYSDTKYGVGTVSTTWRRPRAH